MTVSGVNHSNELAGVQSVAAFRPPLTLTATVTADEAHGNAYELFLASPDLAQWINVAGNLNPGNGSFFGIWINYDNSGLPFLNLGDKLYADPSTNSEYTIQIFIENTGIATVSLFSATGVALGVQPNLNVGTNLVLSHPRPARGRSQCAGRKCRNLEKCLGGSPVPAPVLGPITWTSGTLTLAWTAVAGATYQAQYATSLSPVQWNDLESPVTAAGTLATTTDTPGPDPERFYRVFVLP